LISVLSLCALLTLAAPATLIAQSSTQLASVNLPDAPPPSAEAPPQPPANADQTGTSQTATPLTDDEKKKQQRDEAERQLKKEEGQHLLGVVPSFSVVYGDHAPPLDAKQKFELAFRGSLNTYEFVAVGLVAAIGQAQDSFPEYGQGWEGYGKRYGAGYLDSFDGNIIGNAILPTLWHQDPRYFRMGTGSKKKRLFYSVISAVRCKGDNGKWQPGYSNVIGNIAAGGISNLYYPASDRGFGLTIERGVVVTAEGILGTILQEFVPDFQKRYFHKKPPASTIADSTTQP
jgi:hypothetical protein